MLSYQNGWRVYQKQLKRQSGRTQIRRIFVRCIFLTPLAIVLIYGIMDGLGSIASYYQPDFSNPFSTDSEKQNSSDQDDNSSKDVSDTSMQIWNKQDVRFLLSGKTLLNTTQHNFNIKNKGQNLNIETSLDTSLQRYMLKKISQSYIKDMGFVAIEPSTGRVISMVGFDKTGSSENPCTQKRFPAASIFKIITAAAAIEICGLNDRSELSYNGKKYTLYRNQLNEKHTKYTNKITLADSFAQSINPVFGKLGALYLGKSVLQEYATGFGFNKEINFELNISKSVLSISDNPFNQAEVASGFNRKTLISPLHGALLACAILNNGQMPEPTIIDKITSEDGRLFYKNNFRSVNQAVSSKTCVTIKKLMNTTIKSGTCRKTFKGYNQDKILSDLSIGGKTGSINSRIYENVRYEWFVGFAEEKKGAKQIALAVFVAHDQYIGTRASHYARVAIRQYFKPSENDASVAMKN
ncbi:Penicillin-binding protein transpeptidase domain-containing protein [Candidatus Magnetomoraceae bacterium gMMP-15]